jgi:tRNA-2-methylthio-N6-dimethylallyladenosine synthase
VKAYIITYGCQMNKYTSKVAESVLSDLGYTITDREEDASLILVNTCSVREHAEKRAIGRLAVLAKTKRERPSVILGVLGCMATRLREKLFTQIPELDFAIGSVDRLAEAMQNAKCDGIFEASRNGCYSIPPQRPEGELRAFVAISTGCDNRCSYCIVPYVRGRLKVRRRDDILSEAKALAGSGTKEITLLGQDVTSWREKEASLSALLYEISEIEGIERIRFLTSHPKGVEDRLIDAVAENDKVCSHFHIPLQSGSDRILSLMNRGYTVSYYHQLVERIREKIPHASITTDIIVGFCTESTKDFEDTLRVLERIEPDASFCFKYSVRPETKAALLRDDVPEGEKIDRLKRVIELTKEISLAKNRALIGTEQEVLVEDVNPKDPTSLFGRTATDKVVVFKGHKGLIKNLLSVKIVDASAYALYGAHTCIQES